MGLVVLLLVLPIAIQWFITTYRDSLSIFSAG